MTQLHQYLHKYFCESFYKHFHKKRWLAPCAALAFLASANNADGGPFRPRLRPLTHHDRTLREIGDYTQLILPISAFLYSSSIGDWEGDAQLAKSFLTTAASTQLLKYTIQKDRPDQDPDKIGLSFPSGHTSAAFSGAAYWQTRYGWEVGAPMYAAAALVGYTRVRAHKHDYWDVIGGAALGIGVNHVFVTKYHSEPIEASIFLEGEYVMLRFVTRF